MADIQCVFQSMTGVGSIYISNFVAAQDLIILKKRQINAILSVARSGLLHHSKEDIPYYLYIPALDHEEYELYKHFNETYEFIEQARKHTNVLIHCMVGVSRSVTVVIAYLLKKFKCSLRQVIIMLQRKRNKINPNKGFIEQLKKYTQQQGLKCDFQGIQVPNYKQRSQSAQKINKVNYLSSPKNTNLYKFTSPIKSKEYKIKQQVIQPQINIIEKTVTATTKDDTINTLKKSEQLKPSQHFGKFINKNQEEFNSMTLPPNIIPLKKGYSLDKRKAKIQIIPEEKKISIQQKISLVRQKLFKKQEQLKRRQSQQKQCKQPQKPNKQNTIQQLSTIKPSKKNIDDYLLLYSTNHQISNIKLGQHKQTQLTYFIKQKDKKEQNNYRQVIIDPKINNKKLLLTQKKYLQKNNLQ